MKHRDHAPMRCMLLACCLTATLPAAYAADASSGTTPPAATAAVGTSATTETRLGGEFAGFLGGETQARAVISGLRQGTAFSLGTATAGTATTAIDPPTGTMGYGNVRITLRLAQAELNQLGIAQPTAEELSAVLLGGTVNGTPVDGILALRAEGMGWGQIARRYGMTVGQIMGKGAGVARHAAAASAHSTGNTRAAAGSRARTAQASQARSNGYIPSGNAADGGIVSGTGSRVGAAAEDGAKGPAHKQAAPVQNAGMVSAGGPPMAGGAGNAGGGAKALALGPGKKN